MMRGIKPIFKQTQVRTATWQARRQRCALILCPRRLRISRPRCIENHPAQEKIFDRRRRTYRRISHQTPQSPFGWAITNKAPGALFVKTSWRARRGKATSVGRYIKTAARGHRGWQGMPRGTKQPRQSTNQKNHATRP